MTPAMLISIRFATGFDLQLIPHLEAEFNPALRRHLSVAARAISEANLVDPAPGEPFDGGWRVPAGVLWAMGRKERFARCASSSAAFETVTDSIGTNRSGSGRWCAVLPEQPSSPVAFESSVRVPGF